jgi:hypothetical protein
VSEETFIRAEVERFVDTYYTRLPLMKRSFDDCLFHFLTVCEDGLRLGGAAAWHRTLKTRHYTGFARLKSCAPISRRFRCGGGL